MIVSVSEAARRAGVARSTLIRAMKSGRLSKTTRPGGHAGIEITELERVYGPLTEQDATPKRDDTSVQNAPTDVEAILERERSAMKLENLEAQVARLEAEVAELKNERNRLLGILEQRQLEAPRGWLAGLFGGGKR